MTEKFEAAFKYLIKNEGSQFVNNPADSGGPTKYGITKSSMERFLGRLVPAEEVRDLSEAGAMAFYYYDYWIPLKCEMINRSSISTALLDSAVLYGKWTACNLAQRALSICGAAIKLDGFIGDNTIDAFNFINERDFIHSFVREILQRIDNVILHNPKNMIFKNGWTNRADRLLQLTNNKLN